MVEQTETQQQPQADPQLDQEDLAEAFIQRGGEMIPLNRGDLASVKTIKFSLAELENLQAFQEWLAITVNPHTSQPFIPRDEFSSMIHFCLNFTYRWMGKIAEEMVHAEEAQEAEG